MRLDKFLKVSRLIKRRTIANKVSDQGRIYVNGTIAKPAKQLKEGDIITIVQAQAEVKVKILRVPNNNVSVQEASTLYEVLSEIEDK
ncbi:RNA-binding S4 domain-containing protein [bacterium]|nr:RNA-binding S4 domain-containing protein [bacterium]